MAQSQESLDESNGYPSVDQNFQIEGSTVDKSIIAGQSGESIYQVAGNQIRDFTQNIYNNSSQSENIWSKEQLLQFQEQEEILRAEFQDTLYRAKSLINEIRGRLERRLNIQPPKEKDELLRLIDELQSLLRLDSTLESIENDSIFEYEAAQWLEKEKNYIEQFVTSKIFSRKTLNRLRDSCPRNLSMDQLKKRFREDIAQYMRWIKMYISTGMTPVNFNKEWVKLDFASDVYKEAFLYITDELLDPEVSKLSIDAAETIASYINMFLIDRDLDLDV